MPSCPTCRGAAGVHPDNPYAPFCSRRCKLADLGKWLDEDYRIVDPDLGGPDMASPELDPPPRTNGSAR